MADTVLTELKIHEFDGVEQMSQYESEIGENDIVYTPDVSVRLPILTPMWFDHQVNDESWLNADTFSWQSGDVYKAAYNHLVDDAFSVTINGEKYYAWHVSILSGTTYYTKSFAPNQGDIVYEKSGTGEMVATEYTVTSVAGNELTLSDGSIVSADVLFVFTETIGDITITYYQAKDGHRICLPDQESNLVALYEATGVAWYYLLDQTNQQFKLPRTKWGFTGLRDVVGNYVEPTLPNIIGDFTAAGSDRAANGAFTIKSSIGCSITGTTSGHTYGSVGFNASDSSAIYKDGATVQPPATQMHLYFYVGNFEQDAVEQTAGLNAEMFNGKADRNLLNTTDNVDIVVESQLPTEANGHTWYRKYKSGWVEQGGSALGVGSRTATFPVPMADTNYSVMAVANRSDADAITGVSYTTKTTTSVNFAVSNINKDAYTWNSSNGIRWEVKGMAA